MQPGYSLLCKAAPCRRIRNAKTAPLGAQHASEGGLIRARLVCPPESAYGDNGHSPTMPGGATLIFEIELLEIAEH